MSSAVATQASSSNPGVHLATQAGDLNTDVKTKAEAAKPKAGVKAEAQSQTGANLGAIGAEAGDKVSRTAERATRTTKAGYNTVKGKAKDTYDAGKTKADEASQAVQSRYSRAEDAFVRSQTAAPGTRPITASGYQSFNLSRIGAVVGLGLGTAALFFPTTVLIPLSYICFGTGGLCALDWLSSSIYRGQVKGKDPSAQPLVALDAAQPEVGAQGLDIQTSDFAAQCDALAEKLKMQQKDYEAIAETKSKDVNKMREQIATLNQKMAAQQEVLNGEAQRAGRVAKEARLNIETLQPTLDSHAKTIAANKGKVQELQKSNGDLKKEIADISAQMERTSESLDNTLEGMTTTGQTIKVASDAMASFKQETNVRTINTLTKDAVDDSSESEYESGNETEQVTVKANVAKNAGVEVDVNVNKKKAS